MVERRRLADVAARKGVKLLTRGEGAAAFHGKVAKAVRQRSVPSVSAADIVRDERGALDAARTGKPYRGAAKSGAAKPSPAKRPKGSRRGRA